MFPCSDEAHAKRKLQEYCIDEEDVYILKSTNSRYKKVQTVIITSEEFEFISTHNGYVFIGMMYTEGFHNASNCKSAAMEVWPPINSAALQYLYTVQNCSINFSDCATGIGKSIAPWFDAYCCGSLDSKYDISIPESKYHNLHYFVQARLELLFLCNHSNDVVNKLREGDELLHSLLDMRTKQFVFYDLLSFELLAHTVNTYKYQIETRFSHFFRMWKTMELKLLQLRILFNFINYTTCDLRTITQDFLVKNKETGYYTYKKDEIHMLYKDDKNHLERIISQKDDEEKDVLSLFEAVSFANVMCSNRVSNTIERSKSGVRSINNPFVQSFYMQSIFDGRLFDKSQNELLSKVFDIISKYMNERVSVLIGNIVKTYDMNELKEETVSSHDAITPLVSKNLLLPNQVNDLLPKCISNIIKSEDGYRNSFVFQFVEAHNIDIEDLIQDRPKWRNALNNQQLYIAKTDKSAFMPPCGWMMSNGLCPHLTKPADINDEKKDTEVHIYKRIKTEKKPRVEIPTDKWRDTMIKCKVDRNRNYRNPDDSFHKSPSEYINKRKMFAKNFKKYIDKKVTKFGDSK